MTSNRIVHSQSEGRLARHLAAHTVVALRAGFRVEHVALDEITETQSGVRCDWRQVRSAYNDDTKLVIRGFALAYIGGLIDEDRSSDFSELHRLEVKLDMASSETVRETAVAWGLVPSIQNTNPFAHSGYKLASRLMRQDQAVIETLAALLTEKNSIEELELLDWFEKNAPAYPLEDLEKTSTY